MVHAQEMTMRSYEFVEQGSRDGIAQIRLTIIESGRGRAYCRTQHDLTPATYRRFARAANSGDYHLALNDQYYGDGIEFTLWKPSRCGPLCQFCDRPALRDDIFCAAHRQREAALFAND